MPAKWQVELAICTGMEAPIPALPPMFMYTFAVLGPLESKRAALARRNRLAKLNPGVPFVAAKVEEVERG